MEPKEPHETQAEEIDVRVLLRYVSYFSSPSVIGTLLLEVNP